MTHAQLVTGTGGTTAGATTQIGANLTLPAGGPWIIHNIWGMVAKDTTVPNEGTGGALQIRALSGDLTPDPAPGTFPLIGNPVSESANAAIAGNPVSMWMTDWNGAGKAVISLSYINQLAITTGSDVAAGIIFGSARPERRPIRFCDFVQDSFASAAEQQIGTITLSERATRITGVLADLNKGDAPTAGEPILATIRLASNDVQMPPAAYPCNRCFDASDGTAAGAAGGLYSQFIPVDIPVVGGARIDCFATTTASVTGNADVSIYLAYE